MSALSSNPRGYAMLGWRRVFLTALAFCLAPAVVGGLLLAASWLLGPAILGDNALRTEGLATFALVSPLIGLPIWGIIGLAAVLLLRTGNFGWLVAVVLGVLAFGVLAKTGVGSISLPFGAASGLLFRSALALQRPMAF